MGDWHVVINSAEVLSVFWSVALMVFVIVWLGLIVLLAYGRQYIIAGELLFVGIVLVVIIYGLETGHISIVSGA